MKPPSACRATARLALLFTALSTAACSSLGSFRSRVFPASAAQARLDRAVTALDRPDFTAARGDLSWLIQRCRSGSRGRHALLLLAAADLDRRNPGRSPAEAAHLARAYLQLPDADSADLPLARSLYLTALDLRGLPAATSVSPDAREALGDSLRVAARFDDCDGRVEADRLPELPSASGATTAQRMAHLQATLTANEDSLARAKEHLSADAAKIDSLEAEIERIRKLLGGDGRGGGGGGSSPLRR